MQSPKLDRLNTADFQGADPNDPDQNPPAWFPNFLDVLNGLLEDLRFELGTGKVAWKTFDIVAANPTTATAPTVVTHGLKGRPSGVFVGCVTDLTDGSIPASAISAQNWTLSQDGSQVIVKGFTGLTANHAYRITLKIEQA